MRRQGKSPRTRKKRTSLCLEQKVLHSIAGAEATGTRSRCVLPTQCMRQAFESLTRLRLINVLALMLVYITKVPWSARCHPVPAYHISCSTFANSTDMAPAVEIVTFVATEAYKKDRSVTNPAAELLQSVPGFIRYVPPHIVVLVNLTRPMIQGLARPANSGSGHRLLCHL